MSYALVARGVLVVVACVASYAAGHTRSNIRGNKAKDDALRKMHEENERERAEARAFFESIVANNANIEAALASILANPPRCRDDVIDRLRSHGVLEVLIAKIMTELDAKGFFKAAS
jgi:hypothetical protein